MLYIFFGDRYKARESARTFVGACKKKLPGAEYIKIDPDNPQNSPEELLYGKGLFENRYIVFLDELLSHDLANHILSNPKAYQLAPHAFVLFEPNIDSKSLKKLEKVGAKVYEFKDNKKEKLRVNTFVLADCLAERDRKGAFKNFHKLLGEGEDIELLLGVLTWQIRALILAKNSRSATDSGLKPFPYNKAKKCSEKFSDDELFDMLLNLDRSIRMSRMLRSEEPIEKFLISQI